MARTKAHTKKMSKVNKRGKISGGRSHYLKRKKHLKKTRIQKPVHVEVSQRKKFRFRPGTVALRQIKKY